jgi:2-haloacid dehalogenase
VTEATGKTPTPIDTVLFDVGGVLIDWNPRHLYRKEFAGDDETMERFLDEVCTPAWHSQHDLGVPFEKTIPPLVAAHPEWKAQIELWGPRFGEMWSGEVPGTVDLLAELRETPIRLLAITNWSDSTWPLALQRFEFLGWFEAVVVSGEERLAKPDRRLFDVCIERHGLDPARTLFVDDNVVNLATAAALGFVTHRFRTAEELRRTFVELDLLPAGP